MIDHCKLTGRVHASVAYASKKIGRGISAAARTTINHKISVNGGRVTKGRLSLLLFYIIPGG